MTVPEGAHDGTIPSMTPHDLFRNNVAYAKMMLTPERLRGYESLFAERIPDDPTPMEQAALEILEIDVGSERMLQAYRRYREGEDNPFFDQLLETVAGINDGTIPLVDVTDLPRKELRRILFGDPDVQL